MSHFWYVSCKQTSIRYTTMTTPYLCEIRKGNCHSSGIHHRIKSMFSLYEVKLFQPKSCMIAIHFRPKHLGVARVTFVKYHRVTQKWKPSCKACAIITQVCQGKVIIKDRGEMKHEEELNNYAEDCGLTIHSSFWNVKHLWEVLEWISWTLFHNSGFRINTESFHRSVWRNEDKQPLVRNAQGNSVAYMTTMWPGQGKHDSSHSRLLSFFEPQSTI